MDVSSHLALPRETPQKVNYEKGGFFGTQTELADAIHRAVAAWLPSRNEQPHLVINLSLGWDPRYGGGPDQKELKAPVEAVRSALEYASCLGALVIASAGNDSGGPQPGVGPVLPAQWEAEPAPREEQCKRLAGDRYEPLPRLSEKVYQPLLFSVGGVTGDDRPLPIGRPKGRSRLAAPAVHGVAARYDLTPAPSPTDVLSGTSVSAAVASGIAATIWGYRPKLQAPEVMEIVFSAGIGLDEDADYCLGGLSCLWPSGEPRREIRRLSLCEALRKACSSSIEACPDPALLPTCVARPAKLDARAVLSDTEIAAITAPPADTHSAAAVDDALPPLPVCAQPGYFNSDPIYAERPCPERQLFGAPALPWTFSQPTSNPCPLCNIRWTPGVPGEPNGAYRGTLYIQIDSSYPGQLVSPTLMVPGIGHVTLPDVGILTAGSVRTITDINIPSPPQSGAVLSFAVAEPMGGINSSTVAVLLDQLDQTE